MTSVTGPDWLPIHRLPNVAGGSGPMRAQPSLSGVSPAFKTNASPFLKAATVFTRGCKRGRSLAAAPVSLAHVLPANNVAKPKVNRFNGCIFMASSMSEPRAKLSAGR